MELPVKIRITRFYPCCGLEYSQEEGVCPHCHGLSDQEVAELKQTYQEEAATEANLGHLIIYLAVLLVIGLVILGLSHFRQALVPPV